MSFLKPLRSISKSPYILQTLLNWKTFLNWKPLSRTLTKKNGTNYVKQENKCDVCMTKPEKMKFTTAARSSILHTLNGHNIVREYKIESFRMRKMCLSVKKHTTKKLVRNFYAT